MTDMSKIKTVCVYCGSGPGTNPRFVEAAIALGKALAESGIRLVYGGGSIGLMGAVATSVLDHGGTVTGIIPGFLTARENALKRVQELIVTPDMHERKRLMFEHSDAFVALPGGIGTLEELVEQLTWQQLGRHSKPVLLANIERLLGAVAGAARAYARDAIHSAKSGGRYSESRTGRGYPAAAASRGRPRQGRHRRNGPRHRAPPVSQDHDPIRLNRIMISSLLFKHDLFGKPVPTFPDHALPLAVTAAVSVTLAGTSRPRCDCRRDP